MKVNFILQLTSRVIEMWQDYAGFENYNDAMFCRDLHIKRDSLNYRIVDLKGKVID